MLTRILMLSLAALIGSAQTPDREVVRKEVADIQQEMAALKERVARLETLLQTAPPASESSTRTRSLDTGSRQQCTATTKKGTRCLRLAQPETSTCWQH